MKLRYNVHASISVSEAGHSLITDPWFYEPIYGGMMWQYPRCKVNLKDLIDSQIVLISHFHPDHYCQQSLKHFFEKSPIFIIPKLSSCTNLREFLLLSNQTFIEVSDFETISIGPFLVTFVHSDNQIDTAHIISSKYSGITIFNMNDCFLDKDQLVRIRTDNKIDHSMIFFMGVGHYPGSFVMKEEDKYKIIESKRSNSYKRALQTINLLRTNSFTAYSNDMTWFRRPDLISLNFVDKYDFYMYFKDSKLQSQKAPFILDIASGDSFDFKYSSITSDFIKPPYSKKDILSDCDELLTSDDFVRQISHLELLEKSFELNLDLLNHEMSMLCLTLASVHYSDLDDYLIVISFSETKDYSFLKSSTSCKLFEDIPLLNFDLRLTIPSHLWGCVQNGLYSSEDLLNCRILIERLGSYSIFEEHFWRALGSLKSNTPSGLFNYKSISISN